MASVEKKNQQHCSRNILVMPSELLMPTPIFVFFAWPSNFLSSTEIFRSPPHRGGVVDDIFRVSMISFTGTTKSSP